MREATPVNPSPASQSLSVLTQMKRYPQAPWTTLFPSKLNLPIPTLQRPTLPTQSLCISAVQAYRTKNLVVIELLPVNLPGCRHLVGCPRQSILHVTPPPPLTPLLYHDMLVVLCGRSLLDDQTYFPLIRADRCSPVRLLVLSLDTHGHSLVKTDVRKAKSLVITTMYSRSNHTQLSCSSLPCAFSNQLLRMLQGQTRQFKSDSRGGGSKATAKTL